MAKAKIDIGRHLQDSVSGWASAKAVPVVLGQLLDGRETLGGTVVLLELDKDGDLAVQLLSILERCQIRLIAFSPVTLTSEDVQDAADAVIAQQSDSATIREVRSCAEFVGSVATIEFNFFLGDSSVVLRYIYGAPWHFILLDAASDQDTDKSVEDLVEREEYAAAQREKAKWTAKLRSESAQRIAEHPDLAHAKSEADKVLITREVLGNNTPENDTIVKEISRDAYAIFKRKKLRKG